jgi:large subunit ribosomal protein L28
LWRTPERQKRSGAKETRSTLAAHPGTDLIPGTTLEGFWSLAMAQVCDVCGKGPQFGNNISHAHNVTRRRWNPNLQAVHALVNGAAKRIRVCTNCIKSGKVAKA